MAWGWVSLLFVRLWPWGLCLYLHICLVKILYMPLPPPPSHPSLLESDSAHTQTVKFLGKVVDSNECRLLFNNIEIGQPEDASLITHSDRIYNTGQEKHFKLLGVLFDEYLSFDDHIAYHCTKISESLFCIDRIKNLVNEDSLKHLYFAMVHSHLFYCLNVYSCANSTALQKLSLKQKEAIRVINLAGYRDHTKPLFQKC